MSGGGGAHQLFVIYTRVVGTLVLQTRDERHSVVRTNDPDQRWDCACETVLGRDTF